MDHPRIRGEHNIHPSVNHELGGIIPAYAGSTCAYTYGINSTLGSSPHTRGAPSRDHGALLSLRCFACSY